MNYKKEIFNKYAQKVAEVHNITTDKLFSKDKTRAVVDARHMLYFLCKKRPMKLTYIEQFMKESGYNIGHSSIIHGINAVEDDKVRDKDFMAVCKSIDECVTL
jgi:chromosomal replication initiation ATPase DnaA|tara:strand:+ start:153 stop:461 length:309 start_codon:yes stop_codon:yes gene_type:complete